MKIKKLYGCINRETGELVPAKLYASNKYAWCNKGSAKSHFSELLEAAPQTYRLVELRPIPLLGES